MNYIAIITSSNNGDHEYQVNTRSAVKAAYEYGNGQGGEVVTIVRPRSGKVIAQARWDCERRRYYNCCI